MSGGDDFMKNDYEQIGVGAGKHGNVHWYGGRVRFIQTHPQIALTWQK